MLTVLFDNVILYQTIENTLQIMIRRTVYLIKNIQSLSGSFDIDTMEESETFEI